MLLLPERAEASSPMWTEYDALHTDFNALESGTCNASAQLHKLSARYARLNLRTQNQVEFWSAKMQIAIRSALQNIPFK